MSSVASNGLGALRGIGDAPMLRPSTERPGDRTEDVMVRALRQESHASSEAVDGQIAVADAVAEGEEPAIAAGSPPESPEPSGGWVGMLVQVLAIAVLASGITLVALKFSGLLSPPAVRVVTFDVLKYENAERAQAMKLMGESGAGAVAPMLSYVSKRLRVAIRTAAGPGTLVVLSQAVVQGQTRDITDQVLQELGLPTKVPTSSPVKASSLVPGTGLPPVTGSADSPLTRLLRSAPSHKASSIVP